MRPCSPACWAVGSSPATLVTGSGRAATAGWAGLLCLHTMNCTPAALQHACMRHHAAAEHSHFYPQKLFADVEQRAEHRRSQRQAGKGAAKGTASSAADQQLSSNEPAAGFQQQQQPGAADSVPVSGNPPQQQQEQSATGPVPLPPAHGLPASTSAAEPSAQQPLHQHVSSATVQEAPGLQPATPAARVSAKQQSPSASLQPPPLQNPGVSPPSDPLACNRTRNQEPQRHHAEAGGRPALLTPLKKDPGQEQ
jgi:hypothetical protein